MSRLKINLLDCMYYAKMSFSVIMLALIIVIEGLNISAPIPMDGEGDGSMFDPKVIEAVEKWSGPATFSSKYISWTGKTSWRVILDITDEVIFVGTEEECFDVMSQTNSLWDRTCIEAKIAMVYGLWDIAEKADSTYQAKIEAMQADFAAFMANINEGRK